MKKGLFVTVEGPEGAGKTTVINQIAKELAEEGYPVVLTREPGGSPIAEKIRNIILDKSHTEMDARTEALLYAASRRQHLVEKVIPELNKGSLVLCDRFIDASLAYQGHAREIGIQEVFNINKFAIDDHMPDLTIYFDLDPEIGLARIKKNRSSEVNRLDLEEMNFHHRVREGYLLLLEKFPERIKKVDAEKSIDEVKAVTKSMILERLRHTETK